MEMDLRHKKILIMGLGLHGGGRAAANWCLARGAQVRITDLKSAAELAPSISKIKGSAEYTLGEHREEDFVWADIVIQNPGVPRESKYLALALKHGAAIENEATLFFKLVGRERIIGVTGTRGKSTTSTLLHRILKTKYPQALLGGNIAIAPMLDIVSSALATSDPVVLELSSWHLENLGTAQLSPHIGVFTNLLPDHLNRYESLSDYGAAKQNIFLHQNQGDYAVLNFDNAYTKELAPAVRSQLYWFSRAVRQERGVFGQSGGIHYCDQGACVAMSDIQVPGDHNFENVLAAVCAAKLMGVNNAQIASVLREFLGLPYRLQKIKTVAGVDYVNDTAATSPDGSMAALRALGLKKNIVLIAGGAAKNMPDEKIAEFARLITATCKALVLMAGTESDRILTHLRQSSHLAVTGGVKSMVEAVAIARSFARPGDCVLLSPGAASFGLFLHEFDRGDQFNAAVQQLIS